MGLKANAVAEAKKTEKNAEKAKKLAKRIDGQKRRKASAMKAPAMKAKRAAMKAKAMKAPAMTAMKTAMKAKAMKAPPMKAMKAK